MKTRICLLLSVPTLLLSLPTLSSVVLGNAEISSAGSELNINADHRTVIDWHQFSLESNESVLFHLPSQEALLVNRVVGNSRSEIFGKVESNGKIIFINPHGVFFGKESQIQMESLIASTLDLNLDLFRDRGILFFEGESSAAIDHCGSIEVENDLTFLARHINQNGKINAHSRVRLLSYDRWDANDAFEQLAKTSTISVTGPIQVPSGSVALGAEQIDLYSLINVSGEETAGTISISKECRIANVHEGAELLADGLTSGSGGKIFLFGKEMAKMGGHMSARGGSQGGDGGLLEISTLVGLDFTGTVSTLAPIGKIGTLIIDPLDLTVTGANLNVTGATPFTPTGAGATLSAATVVAALGGSNVVITTLGTIGAATGNITVNSAILWGPVAATTLTISAANDIFINRDVQHSTATPGGLILTAVRDITVSGAAASVSAGSQNNPTTVTAGRNVIVRGGVNNIAQIGFYTPAAGTSAGPISVSCVDLTVQGGTGSFSGAQIGHGRIDVTGSNVSTTVAANITVNTSGNILLRNTTPSSNGYAVIGHGAATLISPAVENGNISITCGGDLTMDATFAGGVSPLSIGHSSPVTNAAPGPAYTGLIDITVRNNLALRSSNLVGGSAVMIGHGGQFSGTNATSITNADMRICCGGNADLIAGTNGTVRIGNFTQNNGVVITANTSLSIGGNLTMQVNQPGGTSSGCIIGYIDAIRTAVLTGTLNVSVCGNATLSAPVASGNILGIGLRSAVGATPVRVNLFVGGNFTATNISCALNIQARGGDLNFAVGGNFTATMGNANGGSISAGATPTGVTRIFVGGNLFADSSPLGGTMSIGRSGAFQSVSVDIRAGGDIIWPNTFAPALTGPLNIQAGHTFAAGEMWTGVPSQLLSICSQPLATPFNLNCGACNTFIANSSAIIPTCGSFSLSPNGVTTANFSSVGGVTLGSLCTSCAGAASTLTIGTTGNINLVGAVGAINIGSFNTIDINRNLTSTSSINITACDSLNLNAGNSITSTGAGSPITLIADVDNSGSGNLNLLGGNITSNNGPICLAAAPGTFGCSTNNCLTAIPGLVSGATSSVNQTSGTVVSGSGDTTVTASGDINISAAATSISTTSGSVSLNAGNDIIIDENIVSTAGTITSISGQNTSVNNALISASGEVRMLAGNDLSLNGATTIASSTSAVTLVTDNNFPSAPLIGSGTFTMSCTSQITSGAGQPVRIFTALQSSNTICATALINGLLVGSSPFNLGSGPLFQDSLYEVWCTYFSCPFPYPSASLGFPFTVFYKNCLQQVTQQATIVVDQLLVTLHPYDEFPGWKAKFWIEYVDNTALSNEPFMIRRKNLNLFNHPKSYTLLLPE